MNLMTAIHNLDYCKSTFKRFQSFLLKMDIEGTVSNVVFHTVDSNGNFLTLFDEATGFAVAEITCHGTECLVAMTRKDEFYMADDFGCVIKL